MPTVLQRKLLLLSALVGQCWAMVHKALWPGSLVCFSLICLLLVESDVRNEYMRYECMRYECMNVSAVLIAFFIYKSLGV
jgi:hypothetical protein